MRAGLRYHRIEYIRSVRSYDSHQFRDRDDLFTGLDFSGAWDLISMVRG